jgi:hypothetical protein
VRRSTSLTISEVVSAARLPEAGAASVTVRDRGATTTEAEHDGSRRTVLTRGFDSVHIVVKPDDAPEDDHSHEIEITVWRAEPGDPWTAEFSSTGVSSARTAYLRAMPEIVVGPGTVIDACHTARRALGLGIPASRHPSASDWSGFKAVKETRS